MRSKQAGSLAAVFNEIRGWPSCSHLEALGKWTALHVVTYQSIHRATLCVCGCRNAAQVFVIDCIKVRPAAAYYRIYDNSYVISTRMGRLVVLYMIPSFSTFFYSVFLRILHQTLILKYTF